MANILKMPEVLAKPLIVHPDDPEWFRLAVKEIGIKEIPGVKHHPRILWYHSFTRLQAKSEETAWCASFVCAMLEIAGMASTRSAAAASYLTYGRECELRRGAIVVFDKADPDAAGTGHVAFVDRWDDTTVWVLGGNQQNAVSIAPRPRSRIRAVRWPYAA